MRHCIISAWMQIKKHLDKSKRLSYLYFCNLLIHPGQSILIFYLTYEHQQFYPT